MPSAPMDETPDSSLADYRQYYGLTDDPFREDSDLPFFGGGGRRALLEQLQHLCQFSASVLAVLGKPGVGKSRLALALANSFEGEEEEVCLLSAGEGAGAADVLGAMTRHFGLPVESDASVGRLLAALRHFAQVADEEDRLALTVIDDAQHLDEQTLGALTSLLQGQDAGGRRLHIVLFAEPEMVTRLDQFNMHDVLIHDFELPPLSLEDAADYLNFRMEMSDYMGPEVFTETRVEPWWRSAEGSLPRLHDQARQWLLESVSPDGPQVGRHRRPPLPLVHILVVALLLGVLLMVFVYSGGEDAAPEQASTERLADERESQSIDLSDEAPVEEETGTEGETGTENAETGDGQERFSAIEEQTLAPDNAETSESGRATPEAADAEPEPEPESGEVDEASAEGDVDEPDESDETGPTEEPESVPDIPDDEQALLSWRASEYTLQLVGAGSRESVERYVRDQSNRGDLLIYETRRQGEPWFVVVAGRYDSAGEAREAVDDLPQEQRSAGPWPRALNEVQDEIEALRL